MDTDLKLSIIAAVAENGVIGVGGKLPPWKLKTDMKRFAEVTKDHMVIVGRKTHESILQRLGHSLKDRVTVVITSRENYRNPDWVTVNSWEEALSLVKNIRDEVFVIGGAEIYKLALPYTNTICLTEVKGNFQGDAFFPPINWDEWKEIWREEYQKDDRNTHDFSFIILKRKGPDQSFITLEHARVDEQRQVMEEIIKQGVCPFCEENLYKFHQRPILKRTKHWILTENQWPYKNTRVHLLAIHTTHVESIGEMEPEAGKELIELAKWAEVKYGLVSGALALGMRFGAPEASGATVRHLHAQLLAAEITDKNDPKYQPVRFRAG